MPDLQVTAQRVFSPSTLSGDLCKARCQFRNRETLTPIRAFRTSYKGTGWYLKEFTPSGDGQGRRIWLNFGRALPTAQLHSLCGNVAEPDPETVTFWNELL